MPIDLVCGQCQGRLLAEQPGSVVACPHCGTHLHVPGEAVPDEPVGIDLADRDLETAELQAADETPAAAGSLESAASVAIVPAPPAEAVALLLHASSVTTTEPARTESAATPAPSAGMPTIATGEPVAPALVPRLWLILVASYASALTLAFVFLLMQFAYRKTHQLESLPDVVPEVRNGEVALKVASPSSNVAPDHVLCLGETRRFGSLNVTPLRVTLGPLKFEHTLNASTAARESSAPVLKLWLRFENVSRNQHFSPLDPLLLFKRHYQDFGKPDLTNQFLCRTEERRKNGLLYHVFNLSATSEFRIAGQNLDTVLGPGQSLETFIPSEEAIHDLTGDLVWRVQFRKGYHQRTRHGVTTLIDVPFNRSDVKNDA